MLDRSRSQKYGSDDHEEKEWIDEHGDDALVLDFWSHARAKEQGYPQDYKGHYAPYPETYFEATGEVFLGFSSFRRHAVSLKSL